MGSLTDKLYVTPMSFFTLITGSELFKDYVGYVILDDDATFEEYVNHVIYEDNNDNEFTADCENQCEKLKSTHKEIEEKLKIYLKDFLDQYVCGDKECFVQRAESEAKRLTHEAEKIQAFGNQNSIGIGILHTIGSVYSRMATLEEGKKPIYLGVPFLVELVRTQLHIWRTRSKAIKAASEEAPQLAEKIAKRLNHRHSVKVSTLPCDEQNEYMNICWKLDAFDIDVTLARVCQAVLREKSDRAPALKILGEIFQSHASSSRARASSQIVLFCRCGRRVVRRVDDTEINKGRAFYTCSINKGELGYCGYFVWLDKLTEAVRDDEALEEELEDDQEESWEAEM